MKKLMIAAAIACAAAFAQAGSAKWSVFDVYDPSEATAYLISSADLAYADVAKVAADIAAGNFSTYSDAASATKDFDETFQWSGAVSGIQGDYTYWMIAVDDSSDPSMVFVGEEISQTIGTQGSKTFSWTVGENATDWQSVPEPTSGLLLLLGVAGLALRRRRA